MAKFLFQGTYTQTGLPGLLKEGGSSRRDAIDKAIQSVGGTLEAFYYVFGDYDAIGIADLPDNESAITLSLIINNSGAAKVTTTVLATPEEVDAAVKKSPTYRPPGQ
jgi:uncharacterized protein with GYD domain